MLRFALTSVRARPASLLLAATVHASRLGIAAAEPSVPIASAKLEVEAEPGCTTRADLSTRVRARSPRVGFVDDGSGLSIRVRISPAPSSRIAAEVALANRGMKSSLRHVLARTCTEAADAVALIIAVTLDPTSADQRSNPGATSESATTSQQTTPSTRRETTAAVAASRTSVPKPGSNNPNAASAAGSELDAKAASRSRPTFGAQLAAEAFVGVAPGVMPGVALFAMAGVDRPSPWSPAFVLGVRHAFRSNVPEPGGNASFTLDAATLDICPIRFRLSVLEVRPCGSALFGRMSASGTDTLNPASESARPFGVIGGAALATADLAWLLEISARLAMGANLVRDSFEFDPATFHTVPAVSAAGSIGIGLRWR